jgi:hypothetical protein
MFIYQLVQDEARILKVRIVNHMHDIAFIIQVSPSNKTLSLFCGETILQVRQSAESNRCNVLAIGFLSAYLWQHSTIQGYINGY